MLQAHLPRPSALLPQAFERLQRELQNSLIDFHNGLRATQGMRSMNLWSKPGEVLVQLELPGYTLEQISVELHDNQAEIKTAPLTSTVAETGRWLQRERDLSPSSRQIQLPFRIDASQSTATYEHGILELKLVALAPPVTSQLTITPKSAPALPEASPSTEPSSAE